MTVTPQIIQPIPTGAQVVLPIDRGNLTASDIRTRPLNSPNVARPRPW